MPNIKDIFTDATVLDYVANREYPLQTGAALFPETKQNSLEVKYIKGALGAPVSATIHAFDSESEIASREGFKEVTEKIALIKRKIGVNEELLIQLNSAKDNSPVYANVINSVYNDIDNMVNAVATRVERMRYEALSTGKITVDENNTKFVIDYGVEASQKETLVTKWGAGGADPLADIEKWMDAMVARGATPTRALTSRRVLGALRRNPILQKAILGTERILSLSELNSFLEEQGLPVVGTEDRVYRVQKADGTYEAHRYFADNKFVLLPDGPLGKTVYGPTPEEIRLSSNPAVDITKVGNILAMVYDETVDPVATYTNAVATALPSFEAADQVFIADVLEASV